MADQAGVMELKSRNRILILAANPKTTPKLRLDEEVREIKEGLRRSKYRDQFEIHSVWAVRRRDLRRALLDHQPHIVHFSGHGNKEGLLVEDEVGFGKLFSSMALAELFKLCANDVECVILSACYSAPHANAISKHINYVIGMKKEIEDKSALEFAVGFYDALGAGKSVEEAFQFGRAAIMAESPDLPEHLVPVLKKKPAYSQTEKTFTPPLFENQENQGRTVDKLPPQQVRADVIKAPEEVKKPIFPMWRIGIFAALVLLMYFSVLYFDKLQSVNGGFRRENSPLHGINGGKELPKTTVEKEEKKQSKEDTTKETREDHQVKANDEKKTDGKIVVTHESPSTQGEIIERDIKNSSNAPGKGKDSSVSKTGNTPKETCDLPELKNNTSPPLYPTTIISAKADGNSMGEAYSNARKIAVLEFFGKCPSKEEYQKAFHRMYCNKLKNKPDGRFYVEVIIYFYKKEEK